MTSTTVVTPIPPLLGERRALAVGGIALVGVGEALGAGAIAFATRELFAALHGSVALPREALWLLAAGALAVATLRVVGRTLAERIGQSYAIAVRRALYGGLAALPQSTLDERRAGALALRFVGDLTALREWAGLGLARLLAALTTSVGAAAVLWLFDPRLARAAAVPLASALLVASLAALAMHRLQRRLRAKRGRIAVDMSERVVLAPRLERLGRTRRELRRLEADGARLRTRAVARTALTASLRALPELGAALAGIAVLVATARFDLPPSDAAGALALLAIVSLALAELADVWDRFCAWRIARGKCERLLAFASRPAAAPETTDEKGSDDGASARGSTPIARTTRPRSRPRARATRPAPPVDLRFENVVFRALRADLEIAAGERALLSGKTGAGKSSLLALAAALETPERGRVRYECRDGGAPTVLHVDERSPILRGSLRRALTLGVVPRPPDSLLEAVLDELGLARLAERLGGLGGRVAEAGGGLSAVERQRLLLARVLLSRAGLLLVDLPALGYDGSMRDALVARLGASDARPATLVLALPAGTGAPPIAPVRIVIEDGVARRDEGPPVGRPRWSVA